MKERTYIRDGRAPTPKDERTSRVMSSIKAKNTKPELLLREALWRNNIRGYRLHWKKVPGRPDIAFPQRKIAIFINGCFWHRCPNCELSIPKSNTEFWTRKFEKNTERDEKKTYLLKNIGWDVLTIWECEVNTKLNQQVKKVEKLING